MIRPPILAIDPGPLESAWVFWNGERLQSFAKEQNEAVIERVKEAGRNTEACAVEMIASYGMPVGAEVFETVYWSGRFAEAYGPEHVHRIARLAVKMHLCHDRAKDANIRRALIDRFGKPGTKARPGDLYGVASDVGPLWRSQ